MSTADHIVLQKISEAFKLFIHYINHGQIKAVDVKSQAVLQNVVDLSHHIYTALAFTMSFGSENMSDDEVEMVNDSGALYKTSTEDNQNVTQSPFTSTAVMDKRSDVSDDVTPTGQQLPESDDDPVIKKTCTGRNNITQETQLNELEKKKREVEELHAQIKQCEKNYTEAIQDRNILKEVNDALNVKTTELEQEIDTLNVKTSKLEQENDTLTKQTSKLKVENETLSEQTSKLENENGSLKEMLKNTTEDLKICKETFESEKRANDDTVHQYKVQKEILYTQLNEEIMKVSKLEDDFKKCKDLEVRYKNAYEDIVQRYQSLELSYQVIHTEKKDLSKRLAEEWSDKVGANESDLENISIKCRPINIADDYVTFASREWLNVKDELDNKIEGATEEEKAQFLCDILIMCKDHCAKTYNEWNNNLFSSMLEPCKAVYSQRRKRRRHVGVGIETLQSVKVFKDIGNYQNKEKNELAHHDDKEVQGDIGATEIINKQAQCCKSESDHVKKNYATSTGNEECSPGPDDTDWNTNSAKQLVNSREEEQMDIQEQSIPQSEEESHEEVRNVPLTKNNNEISENPDVKFTEMILLQEWIDEEDVPWVATELHKEPSSDKLSILIGDYLRTHSDEIDIGNIVQDIIDKLSTNQKWDINVTKYEHFKDYVAGCVKLTWKMAIQRPPMRFERTGLGERWDEVTQEPTFGGDNPKDPDSRVKYYLLPTLMHGTKVMTKGKVLTQKTLSPIK